MRDVVIHLGSEKRLVRALARRVTERGYLAVVQAKSWDIHVDTSDADGTLGELLGLVESFLAEEAAPATIRVDGRSYVFDPPPRA